jgi:hypothetical protein
MNLAGFVFLVKTALYTTSQKKGTTHFWGVAPFWVPGGSNILGHCFQMASIL